MLIMLFLIGTFGFNFPIFISTTGVNVFHSDARASGLLSSMMAVGTLPGFLLPDGQTKLRVSGAGGRSLLARPHPGRTGAWILVVSCRSRVQRRGCLDVHERHEQPRHIGPGPVRKSVHPNDKLDANVDCDDRAFECHLIGLGGCWEPDEQSTALHGRSAPPRSIATASAEQTVLASPVTTQPEISSISTTRLWATGSMGTTT